jgi:hypothetical protein
MQRRVAGGPRNVDLPVSDFSRPAIGALGGTNVQSVAFLGQNAVAWLPLAGDVWEFTALDGYDTPIKDGYLNDVVAGDLTGSGRKELVFHGNGEKLSRPRPFDSHHKLVPGDRWQVFEQHTFRGARNALPEPREALVADVTGDKKNDLIVLVHDRILVYPQEFGACADKLPAWKRPSSGRHSRRWPRSKANAARRDGASRAGQSCKFSGPENHAARARFPARR